MTLFNERGTVRPWCSFYFNSLTVVLERLIKKILGTTVCLMMTESLFQLRVFASNTVPRFPCLRNSNGISSLCLRIPGEWCIQRRQKVSEDSPANTPGNFMTQQVLSILMWHIALSMLTRSLNWVSLSFSLVMKVVKTFPTQNGGERGTDCSKDTLHAHLKLFCSKMAFATG